jgi:hypothetical protein
MNKSDRNTTSQRTYPPDQRKSDQAFAKSTLQQRAESISWINKFLLNNESPGKMPGFFVMWFRLPIF